MYPNKTAQAEKRRTNFYSLETLFTQETHKNTLFPAEWYTSGTREGFFFYKNDFIYAREDEIRYKNTVRG